MGIDLRGKNIVFTGTLTRMSRQEAIKIAQAAGMSVSSQVTHGTDYLVWAEDPKGLRKGRGLKVEAAEARGVQTWTEYEFFYHAAMSGTKDRTTSEMLLHVSKVLEDVIEKINSGHSNSQLLAFVEQYRSNIEKQIMAIITR